MDKDVEMEMDSVSGIRLTDGERDNPPLDGQ